MKVSGVDCVIDGVIGDIGGGRCVVKCHGNRNTYLRQIYRDFGNKGFAKDNAPGGLAADWTRLEILSAISDRAVDMEAFLFDQDGVQGGHADVHLGWLDLPNMTGPDSFKVAYLDSVTLRGVRGDHGITDAFRCSFRLQQGLKRVLLEDCHFPGSVNCDFTGACTMTVRGGTIFGNKMEIAGAVEDFIGTLNAEDGTEFRNLRLAAVIDNTTAVANVINIGRAVYHGAAGYTPTVCRPGAFSVSGSTRRLGVGQITVREPLRVEGTMKSRAVNGRWIALSETQDAACAQAGDRVFLAAASDFPPRDAEGWRLGDVLRLRAPTSLTTNEVRCVTAGASTNTAWAASTVYATGAWVYNGANVYACTTGGTSAASGGPTGTGTGIADNTAVWAYVAPRAAFSPSISSVVPFFTASTIANIAGAPNVTGKYPGKVVLDTTNNRLMATKGSAAGDAWYAADGSATVTPA